MSRPSSPRPASRPPLGDTTNTPLQRKASRWSLSKHRSSDESASSQPEPTATTHLDHPSSDNDNTDENQPPVIPVFVAGGNARDPKPIRCPQPVNCTIHLPTVLETIVEQRSHYMLRPTVSANAAGTAKAKASHAVSDRSSAAAAASRHQRSYSLNDLIPPRRHRSIRLVGPASPYVSPSSNSSHSSFSPNISERNTEYSIPLSTVPLCGRPAPLPQRSSLCPSPILSTPTPSLLRAYSLGGLGTRSRLPPDAGPLRDVLFCLLEGRTVDEVQREERAERRMRRRARRSERCAQREARVASWLRRVSRLCGPVSVQKAGRGRGMWWRPARSIFCGMTVVRGREDLAAGEEGGKGGRAGERGCRARGWKWHPILLLCGCSEVPPRSEWE